MHQGSDAQIYGVSLVNALQRIQCDIRILEIHLSIIISLRSWLYLPELKFTIVSTSVTSSSPFLSFAKSFLRGLLFPHCGETE